MQSSHKVHYSVSLFGTKLASRQIDNRARQSSYICIKSRLTLGLVFFPSVDREDAIGKMSSIKIYIGRTRHKGEFIVDHRTQIFVEISVVRCFCAERRRGRKGEGERRKKREREI